MEIGSETGSSTRDLARWCESHGAELVVIEPAPSPEVAELDARSNWMTLVTGRSPAALAQVGGCDAYLIDGDHNYWTVTKELEFAIESARKHGGPLLVILHDVGWPCARRDLYYEPGALPAAAVHPHTFSEGVVPEQSGTVPGGYRGRGVFAFARREGGADNGVLTAVEEVLGDHDGLCFVRLSPVLGLGVIWSADAPWADAVGARLAPWSHDPLLDRLERNRVDLLLRVIELQDEVADLARRQHGALIGLDQQLAAANAELAALRLERARGADREASGAQRRD